MNNNQRDPQWINLPLGDGSTTIGKSGCTISVIGDVLGITPTMVNSALERVGGFSGALVIWNKLSIAFPGITVNRAWTYDNNDVLNQLAAGNQVIVEVPAVPIGGTGSHWVQYIGNQQLKDPWTGSIRPTTDFPNPTGYAVFSGKWNDSPIQSSAVNTAGLDTHGLDATNEASNQIVFNTWNDVKNGLYIPVAQFNALKISTETLQENFDKLNQKYNETFSELTKTKSSLADITKSDYDYSKEAYDAKKLADEYTSYMDDIANELQLSDNNQTDQQLHDTIIKEIIQLRANQKTEEGDIAPEKLLNGWEDQFKNIIDWLVNHGLNDFLKTQGLQIVDLDGNPQDNTIGDRVVAYLDSRFHRLEILQQAQEAVNAVKENVGKSKNLFSQIWSKLFVTT